MSTSGISIRVPSHFNLTEETHAGSSVVTKALTYFDQPKADEATKPHEGPTAPGEKTILFSALANAVEREHTDAVDVKSARDAGSSAESSADSAEITYPAGAAPQPALTSSAEGETSKETGTDAAANKPFPKTTLLPKAKPSFTDYLRASGTILSLSCQVPMTPFMAIAYAIGFEKETRGTAIGIRPLINIAIHTVLLCGLGFAYILIGLVSSFGVLTSFPFTPPKKH